MYTHIFIQIPILRKRELFEKGRFARNQSESWKNIFLDNSGKKHESSCSDGCFFLFSCFFFRNLFFLFSDFILFFLLLYSYPFLLQFPHPPLPILPLFYLLLPTLSLNTHRWDSIPVTTCQLSIPSILSIPLITHIYWSTPSNILFF